MKYILLCILLFASYSSKSQSTVDSLKLIESLQMKRDALATVFTKTEVPPSYPEGEEKLRDYLAANFKSENITTGAKNIDYTVTIRFIVRLDGSSYDFIHETNNGYGLENEIVRILKTIPMWNSAKQNKRPVYSYFRQTMTVHL